MHSPSTFPPAGSAPAELIGAMLAVDAEAAAAKITGGRHKGKLPERVPLPRFESSPELLTEAEVPIGATTGADAA